MTDPQKMMKTQNDQSMLKLAQERMQQATDATEQQEHRTAQMYFQDALEIKESILGSHHMEVVQLYLSIASTLQAQGKHHKSKQNFHQAIHNCSPNVHCRSSTELLSHAWKGLGIVFTDLQKWHEAMTAYETAAWLQLYDFIKTMYKSSKNNMQLADIVPISTNKNFESLESISDLQGFVEQIETKHAKNRKKVWSHFPLLPNQIDAYLEALRTAVIHEVQGDWCVVKGGYGLAKHEFQLAYTYFREKVHSTNHGGIPFEELWLLRKQVLAEWWSKAPLDAMRVFRLDALSPISTTSQKAKTICLNQDFKRVCETMVRADEVLSTSSNDHLKQRQARNLYQEALQLIDIYHDVAQEIDDDEDSNNSNGKGNDVMLQGVDSLQAALVPDGWSQGKLSTDVPVKQIWQELQFLAIRVETKGLPTNRSPRDTASHDSCPMNTTALVLEPSVHCEAQDWWWLGIFALLILCQFMVLPWLLWRKSKMMQGTLSKPIQTSKSEGWKKMSSKASQVSKHEPQGKSKPMNHRNHQGTLDKGQYEPSLDPSCSSSLDTPLIEEEDATFGTEQTMSILQALDRFEARVGNKARGEQHVGFSTPMAQQVSAKVWIQKTRSLLLSTLVEEGVDKALVDGTDEALKGRLAFDTFENRIKDMGLFDLWVEAQNETSHQAT